MTRKLIATLLLIALLLPLGGCSGGKKDVDPAEAAQAIVDSVTFRDTLVAAEDGAAENYYKLDDSIDSYGIFISGSGATAEEVAVLKVKDSKDLNLALAILDKRLADLTLNFQDYVPEEMVKISNPVIVVGTDVAILVVADDYEEAKTAAESQIQ